MSLEVELISVHGLPYEVRPFQPCDSEAMPESLFSHRLISAIKATSLRNGGRFKDTFPHEIEYWVEQSPFNGTYIFEDEFVVKPNKFMCLGTSLQFDNLVAILWRSSSFPRWVHVGAMKGDLRSRMTVQYSACFGKRYDPSRKNPYFPVQSFAELAISDEFKHLH